MYFLQNRWNLFLVEVKLRRERKLKMSKVTFSLTFFHNDNLGHLPSHIGLEIGHSDRWSNAHFYGLSNVDWSAVPNRQGNGGTVLGQEASLLYLLSSTAPKIASAY